MITVEFTHNGQVFHTVNLNGLSFAAAQAVDKWLRVRKNREIINDHVLWGDAKIKATTPDGSVVATGRVRCDVFAGRIDYSIKNV